MRTWLAPLVVVATAVSSLAGGPDLTGYVPLAKAVVAPTPANGGTQPGYLGIQVEGDGGQVVVRQVDADSPADKAGLKPGDVVRQFAGHAVKSSGELRDRIQACAPGQSVAVTAGRADQSVELNVRLEGPSKLTARRVVLGVVLAADDRPATITEVAPGTPAALAGLLRDDVIVTMDGATIGTAGDVRRRLAERSPGDRVTLDVRRGGETLRVSLTLAAASDEPAGWDDRAPAPYRQPVYRLGVVLVAFPDQPLNARISPAAWEAALFSQGKHLEKNATGQPVFGSVADYFHEMSAGKFRLEGKVLAPIVAEHNRADYAQAAGGKSLLVEVGAKLEKALGRDWLKKFDGLFVVYAGPRFAAPRATFFWPHRDVVELGGTRLSYFICPEGGDRMTGIGTICHEFGHMLGLPDLYSTTGEGGAGVWCTMAIGHGEDGRPVQLSAWCRERLGWVTPVPLDPRAKQKLIIAPGEVAKVLARPDGSEYFLLECRRKQGYDRDLPDEGLVIWRVVDGKPSLVEAHGRERDPKPGAGVPFPSAANHSFTPLTTPSSHAVKPGGWPVYLSQIRRLPDGRASFEIGYEYY